MWNVEIDHCFRFKRFGIQFSNVFFFFLSFFFRFCFMWIEFIAAEVVVDNIWLWTQKNVSVSHFRLNCCRTNQISHWLWFRKIRKVFGKSQQFAVLSHWCRIVLFCPTDVNNRNEQCKYCAAVNCCFSQC